MLPNIFIDQPNQNIKIENFEKEVLYDFLRFQSEDWRNAAFKMMQYAGGDRNFNYLLKADNREFVLRHAPLDKDHSHIEREYKILEGLKGNFRPMPRTMFYCDDPSVIGTPFYVTRRLLGMVMRKHIPVGVEFSPKDLDEMINALLLSMTKLHQVDLAKAKLEDLPNTSFSEQIIQLKSRWTGVKGNAASELNDVFSALSESVPKRSQNSLIHNGLKFENLLFKLNRWHRLVAIFDWEQACLGDPLSDFGYVLANWFTPQDPEILHNFGFNPPAITRHISREELTLRYFAKAEKASTDMTFYRQLGLLRLLVETQEKYARYLNGDLKGKQHKKLVVVVEELEKYLADSF